jgi:hypothetical protein
MTRRDTGAMAPWTLLGSAIALAMCVLAAVLVMRTARSGAPSGSAVGALALLLVVGVATLVLVVALLAAFIENPSEGPLAAGLAGIVIGGCGLAIALSYRRALVATGVSGKARNREAKTAMAEMFALALLAVSGVTALLLTAFIVGAP